MHDGALGRADQVVVLDRTAVGVELLARLEDDGVQPALRIGQLHPVADDERARHRLPGAGGAASGLGAIDVGRFLLRVHGRPAYGGAGCDPCHPCGAGTRNCRWGDLASEP